MNRTQLIALIAQTMQENRYVPQGTATVIADAVIQRYMVAREPLTSLKAVFAEWDESLSNGCNDGNALKYLEKHDSVAAAVYRDAVAAIQKAEGRTA